MSRRHLLLRGTTTTKKNSKVRFADINLSESPIQEATTRLLGSSRAGAALLLLLLGALGTTQAIYPNGHFDHVTKINDVNQLHTVINESIKAGQTLFVRWIA